MKKFKKFLALFSVALFCLVPFFGSVITAEADAPYTWYIKYNEGLGQWRYQIGGWDDTETDLGLDNMYQYVKNGDIIVIDGTGHIELNVDVRLSNLTILNPGNTFVNVKYIDQLYAGGNCVAVVNCDVKEAYVYDQCAVNFNGNVSYLEVICKEGPKANVAVMGTLGHLKGWDGTNVSYEAYNFAAGKLSIAGGVLKTAATDYSTTASAAPAPAPVTPPATSADDEYDDVPKTGDFSFSPMWLISLAVICLAGCFQLKKTY